eukprot:1495206-Amphidinium_carterae.1
MAADALTKKEAPKDLLQVLMSKGEWSVHSTTETLAQKAELQQQRRERKKRLKRVEASEDAQDI